MILASIILSLLGAGFFSFGCGAFWAAWNEKMDGFGGLVVGVLSYLVAAGAFAAADYLWRLA